MAVEFYKLEFLGEVEVLEREAFGVGDVFSLDSSVLGRNLCTFHFSFDDFELNYYLNCSELA